MKKEDQKILYDWILRRMRESCDDSCSDEDVERQADRYFELTFERGYAELFLEFAKNDEPFDLHLYSEE